MRRIRSLACIAAVLALAACAVPPVRYYSLAATPVASAAAAPERPAAPARRSISRSGQSASPSVLPSRRS